MKLTFVRFSSYTQNVFEVSLTDLGYIYNINKMYEQISVFGEYNRLFFLSVTKQGSAWSFLAPNRSVRYSNARKKEADSPTTRPPEHP